MRNELYSQNGIWTENNSRIMGASLLKHAREVYRYAVTYCAPTEDNDYLDANTRASFVRNLKRMIKEMNGLVHMARSKGVTNFCNLEQIEALMDSAGATISNPTRPAENSMLMN